MYGFSDQWNGIPVTGLSAERQGSRRYSAGMAGVCARARYCTSEQSEEADPNMPHNIYYVNL
jgi:hypothetical protein